ncbi:unnamed protein product [Cyprideis torosa]|uniref:Uncharacterized protein n=1 Tax=Cyprideis torosa TaxID=163714 RepID=A0A7R8W145_9CRUS|nr:unnamed protein product [Cyprideis torosa]CAG0880501.1 unnamed protein product [Cyprideis torosa]
MNLLALQLEGLSHLRVKKVTPQKKAKYKFSARKYIVETLSKAGLLVAKISRFLPLKEHNHIPPTDDIVVRMTLRQQKEHNRGNTHDITLQSSTGSVCEGSVMAAGKPAVAKPTFAPRGSLILPKPPLSP